MNNINFFKIVNISLLVTVTLIFSACGGTKNDNCCSTAGASVEFKQSEPNKEKIVEVEPELEPIEKLGKREDSNRPPVALVNGKKESYIEIHHCQNMSFLGDDSSDSDGDIVKYEWIDGYNKVLGNDQNLSKHCRVNGMHERMLTVTDDDNATDFARVCVLYNFDKEDIPLIANAGKDQIVASGDEAKVIGRAICKFDSFYDLDYEWQEDGEVIGTQSILEKSDFLVGDHVLTLKVSDGSDISYSDVTISVE
jgi:hypothetical protein